MTRPVATAQGEVNGKKFGPEERHRLVGMIFCFDPDRFDDHHQDTQSDRQRRKNIVKHQSQRKLNA